jgi:negative regulator of sigma E activity
VNREQLEFRISQYVDNTLSAGERTTLEAELEGDDEGRKLLEEYRGLEQLMRQAPRMEAVDWDAFAGRVSAAVAEEEIDQPSVLLRIGWGGRLAIAASVLIAIGLGISLYMMGGKGPAEPDAPVVVAKVEGPAAEAATQPALVRIEVGARDEVAGAQYQLSEGIVTRPSSVQLIASGDLAGQDTQRSPYQQ